MLLGIGSRRSSSKTFLLDLLGDSVKSLSLAKRCIGRPTSTEGPLSSLGACPCLTENISALFGASATRLIRPPRPSSGQKEDDSLHRYDFPLVRLSGTAGHRGRFV